MKHFRLSRSLTVLAIALLSLGVGSTRGDEKKPEAKPAEAKQKKKPQQKPAGAKQTATKKKKKKKEEEAAAELKKQVDAQVDMMAAQFEQQIRPMLQAELNFIRQTCQLKPQDRPKIKAAGEAGLKAAARNLAISMRQPNAGIFGGGRPKHPDHRTQIAALLAGPLEQALGREGMARFTAQREKWLANRKRAAILSIVARLDSELLLTAQQRAKLVDTITAKWQPDWDCWLKYQGYWPHYFPQELDSLVAPALDADQRAVWASAQKLNLASSFGVWVQDWAREDAWWDGEPEEREMPTETDVEAALSRWRRLIGRPAGGKKK